MPSKNKVIWFTCINFILISIQKRNKKEKRKKKNKQTNNQKTNKPSDTRLAIRSTILCT